MSSPACARVLCNETKKKEGGMEGGRRGTMERVGNTGTSISIETAAKSERLWTFHSRKGVPSFLLVRKESGTERWGQERERTWSWRELARNGRTEWKRKRGRRERMTAGTRSLRSVLSELLLVTVARSCGGGSSITDSSYYDFTVFPFFFSPPQFLLRGLSFFSFRHDDVLHIFCLERVLVSFFSLCLSSLIPLLLPVPRYWC